MAFDFADLKAKTRRVVQDTLGVLAFYQDDSMSAPREIRARWKTKVNQIGDLMDDGYAEIVQGVDRIVLIPSDYPTINFVRGGLITFPAYGRSFRLELLEPSTGPIEAVWQAVDA